MKSVIYKRWFFPLLLVICFGILIMMVMPGGVIYGSSTDWFSQHVALAETIRTACLEQHTLLPDWIALGGGSNGFQFAYYGYLRLDILLGCLLPRVPMMNIIIGYTLAGYLAAVLLCYQWLREELDSRAFAYIGSMLFMTANCFFQTHRQLMFVNFMPYLMLALWMIYRHRERWLAPILCLMLLHSFFYILPILLVLAWYWHEKAGRQFWCPFLWQTAAGIGMAAALLLPTGLVILEHRRSSGSLTESLSVWTPHIEFVLYSGYGIGLSILCLYLLLIGVADKNYRRHSILLLLVTVLGASAYLLNGTLYARGKIMVPFLPLILLHCMRILQTYYQQEKRWRIWPFLVIFGAVLIAGVLFGYRIKVDMYLDVAILALLIISLRKWQNWKIGYALMVLVPCLIYIHTSQAEEYVTEETAVAMEDWQKQADNWEVAEDSFYRTESLYEPLNTGNRLIQGTGQRSTMYSSVTNQDYSQVYYDVLQTPIRINNRVAILTEQNPFLFQFMGVRYLEAEQGSLPNGYEEIAEQGDRVLGENKNVLPMAYVVDENEQTLIDEAAFRNMDAMGKLELLMKRTVLEEIPDRINEEADVQPEGWQEALEADTHREITELSGLSLEGVDLPKGITIEDQGNGSYSIQVQKKEVAVNWKLQEPREQGEILMLQFDVERLGKRAVVIDINGVRNKLSGSSAAYPNGNTQFRYPLTGAEGQPLSELQVTFQKGEYLIRNIRWYSCSERLLQEKQYQTLTPLQSEEVPEWMTGELGRASEEKELLSGSVTLQKPGYLVTSIPLQNGMKLYVDGVETPLQRVNLAFAGAGLEAGRHEVRLTFAAPGKRLGIEISLLTVVIYMMARIIKSRKRSAIEENYSEP